MKRAFLAICAMTLLAAPAMADPWKDESGKGRWRDGDRRDHNESREYKQEFRQGNEYMQEFRQGNCKIERKWERSGEYKEEVKCKRYR